MWAIPSTTQAACFQQHHTFRLCSVFVCLHCLIPFSKRLRAYAGSGAYVSEAQRLYLAYPKSPAPSCDSNRRDPKTSKIGYRVPCPGHVLRRRIAPSSKCVDLLLLSRRGNDGSVVFSWGRPRNGKEAISRCDWAKTRLLCCSACPYFDFQLGWGRSERGRPGQLKEPASSFPVPGKAQVAPAQAAGEISATGTCAHLSPFGVVASLRILSCLCF